MNKQEEDIQAWEDTNIRIPIRSHRLIVEGESKAGTQRRRTYGAPEFGCTHWCTAIYVMPEDLEIAGWHRGAAARPAGDAAAAYAAGVAAAQAAIATIKYDAESMGQPWRIADAKVPGWKP